MNNSNNSSTVLVAGATGFLGSEICRQLTSKNKNVKGLVRATSDSNKIAHLKQLGVETIEGAISAGVGQFIYISFCNMPGEYPLQTAKRKVEKQLAESGLNFTILQPT